MTTMAESLHEQIPSLERRLAREPQSPLFARLASHYLQAGRAQDALRICDEGLAIYPFYSTGHLIKGKVLLELKMLAEAKREFEVVSELLPSSELASRLYSSIDLGPSTDIATTVTEEPAAVVEPMAPEASAPPQEETVTAEVSLVLQADQVVPQVEVAPPQEVIAEELPLVQEEVPAQPAETPRTEEPSSFGGEPTGVEFQEQPQAETTDYGFGVPAESAQPEEPVTEISTEPPAVQPEPYAEPGTTLDEEAVTVEPTTTEETKTEAGQTPDWFEAFSQLEQPPTETAEPAIEGQPEEENPFAAFGAEAELPTPEAPIEGETFEEFAARIRMELFGTEGTLTLDEYLASSSPDQPTAAPDHIEELAEKLKVPTKITPVINFAEKAPRPASEADTPAGSGFVTPTLAEIYVKQGWYDDAIKAYRALAANKPAEREKFEQRITEIEEMKKQQ
jgi:tetratricopeptide (TPR) repeat protein